MMLVGILIYTSCLAIVSKGVPSEVYLFLSILSKISIVISVIDYVNMKSRIKTLESSLEKKGEMK